MESTTVTVDGSPKDVIRVLRTGVLPSLMVANTIQVGVIVCGVFFRCSPVFLALYGTVMN